MSLFEDIDDEDLADRIESMLPDFALEKVRHLESKSAERSGLYRSISAKIAKLSEQIGEWRSLIARTEREWEHDGMAKTAHAVAQIAKWNQRITKANEEIKKLSEERKMEPSLPVHILFEELRELPPGTVLDDARVSVTVGKSENIEDLIGSSRNNIAALTSSRGAVRNARVPLEAAIHRLKVDAAQLREGGEIDYLNVTKLVQPSINMRPRQGRLEAPTIYFETGTQSIELPNTSAMLHHLLHDEIVRQGTKKLKEFYATKPLVIPESEREARIAEIDAEILAESRREEALIEIAESKGIRILRRPNAPPFAVLGVAVGSAAKAQDDLEFG